MKMNKKSISAIIACSIGLLVFIILTLTIPFDKPAAAWVMFAFSIISILASGFICIYAFGKSEKLMSKFYGFPLFRLGVLYAGSQLLATLIVYVIGAFVDVPTWVGLVISVILAGLAGLGCVVADNVRDYVERIDIDDKKSTRHVTEFNLAINDIMDLCKDPNVYERLKKLATTIKYSDPVSIDETKELESRITNELDALRVSVSNNNSDAALDQIDSVTNLMNARNRRCEAFK